MTYADPAAIRHTRHGTVEVITLPEDFDVYNASFVRDVIIRAVDAGQISLVFDFTETAYMDSTGLGVMVGALKRVSERTGGKVGVAAIGERQLEVLRRTGLTRLFAVTDTVGDALTAVAS
jgi:anti-sigma B factor antagonist